MRRVYSLIAMVFAGLIGLPALAQTSTTAGNNVLKSYEQVAQALSNDDLTAAKQAATDLANKAKTAGQDEIASDAIELSKAESLDQAREHFKLISEKAEALARNENGWYVMNCPMAKADWVQSNKEVANPYLGRKMHNCGTLKGMGNTMKSSMSSGCCAMMHG